ncbi:hypothetical protein, partial [Paenibacillus sp. GP183]|uniref:hypothetical protein n=1 Tax=Paenibacillus sp. GP183 TaxID=1882751 RepID=UPI000895C85F
MGKIAEIYENYQAEAQWGHRFFVSQIEKAAEIEEAEKNQWGDRSNIFTLGKKIAEMEWFEKPERLYSAKTQVEKYFGWLGLVKDRRSRRILTAELYDYWVKIPDEKYEELLKDEKKELKQETVHELHFTDIPNPNSEFGVFHDEIMFHEDPVTEYKRWIVEGDAIRQQAAITFGEIKARKQGYVKTKAMSHRPYDLKRAKKYIPENTRNKDKQYINTSMTYQKKNDVRRLGERVTEYCMLFSDLDYYKLPEFEGVNQKKVLQMVFAALDDAGFPRPTQVIFSRGLQLIWLTSPIPEYRYREWQMLQKKIHGILGAFLPDSVAMKDKVRVLRLVGTIHEKTREKIHAKSYTNDRFLFDDLIHTFCQVELEQLQKQAALYRQKALEREQKALKMLEGGVKGKPV